MIYRIDPTDTPFMSGVEKEKATAVNHEWQTQALARPSTTNAQLEGDDPSASTTTADDSSRQSLPDLLQGGAGVGHAAGGGSRRSRQRTGLSGNAQGSRAQARYREHSGGTNQAKAAGNTSTPRRTASVLSWIAVNTSKGTAGGAADPARPTAPAIRTDGTPDRVHRSAAEIGAVVDLAATAASPAIILTGAFNKQVFSTFTGRSTAVEEAKSKKIVASVDAYESDFGKLKVVANRFQRPRDVLVLELDKWAVAYLNGRNMTSIPLAKTGNSDRRQILAEYALVARNEKASGGVFDNTTTTRSGGSSGKNA